VDISYKEINRLRELVRLLRVKRQSREGKIRFGKAGYPQAHRQRMCCKNHKKERTKLERFRVVEERNRSA